ncbi:type II toxin-antitoxin system RelE/ParE family toxin [Cyclobacterium jeungdonense]|uniref:type II toxin-antitoxin system RelE/ParE family toxin n=1 Tax=Cyclobacterium jeungdonense TaxID=708087 RepID=UPI0013D18CA8
MGRYKFTREATKDLHRIWRHTVRIWSVQQADLYFDQLLEMCQLIADNPDLGSERNFIKPGLRGIKKGRHIIFYMQGIDQIHIIRILHERMDMRMKF